jgi:hypothetical protein
MADQAPRKYEPSELKLAYLRALGVRPIAAGLPALLAMLSALVAVAVAGRGLLGPMKGLLAAALSGAPMDAATMPAMARNALLLAIVALAVVGAGGLVGWLTGNALQTGLRSPWSGLQKPSAGHYGVPRRGGADHATRALLAAAVACLGLVTVLGVLEAVAALGAGQPGAGSMLTALCRPVLHTFLPGALALIVLDIVATRYGFTKAAGMTEVEKRREIQDQEIGWLTRLRRRSMRGGGRR